MAAMSERVQQNVLIVTGDRQVTRTLLETLTGRAIHGRVARDVTSALEVTRSDDWDMVMVDLEAAQGDLGRLLQAVKTDSPEMPVILISPRDCVEAAVRAVRAGCDDVLVKPLRREPLEDLLRTLLPNHDVPLAACAWKGARRLYQIIGRSPGLLEVIASARKVAPTSVPVLITGESGTGKELISYLVHHESNRSQGPYIRVNCVALSESLLESELFGHEKGAFTGAYNQRKGRLERAHGGTLLLDEISETGARLQAELLRVLETQDFERVGGSESIRVNVRVVSTTNRDLAAEVGRGGFRRDLYYRIGGIQLTAPPLRERKEDLPLLVWHFVNEFAREARRRITALAPEMLEAFSRFHWPGNVRQLRNVVRAAMLFGEGPTLSLAQVPQLQVELMSGEKSPASTLRLQELERLAVLEALRRTKSHYARAAKLLGITDRTLREKIRRYRNDGSLVEEKTWVRETA